MMKFGAKFTALTLSIAGVCAVGIFSSGCKPNPPPKRPVARYQMLPLRKVPPFMVGTVFQQCDLSGTDPLNISSYGLVSHLRNTGDSTAPTAVRTWMLDYMAKRGFGQQRLGYNSAQYQPEAILNDPQFAIVRVDGYLAPGARKGQTFDIFVSSLPESRTTSLAHGELYETDLSVGGAEVGGANINKVAVAAGPIFVNPAYTLAGNEISNQGKTSLRYGVVMDGGVVAVDRAIGLRIREPEKSLSEHIADRINDRFQGVGDMMSHGGRNWGQNMVASAQDEGRVIFYVPARYRGDWEHFSGVVMHLYMRGDPAFTLLKGRELAAEAEKPDAPLQDITYAWEALGPVALPTILPLMSDSHPDVAFAAARAAAFLDDPSSLTALMQIAQDPRSSFQVSAVNTLAALPPTQEINQMLRQLLNIQNAQVRIAAYQALAHNKDPYIFTRVIKDRFVLDLVPCDGPTMIYASRTGIPRIAIIGKRVNITTPLMFSAMDGRLTIATLPKSNDLSIYYRGAVLANSEETVSAPELAELIARLGGEGMQTSNIKPLDFSYAEILAVLQDLADKHYLVVASKQPELATFAIQDLSNRNSLVYNAPVIAAGEQPDANALPKLNPNDIDNVRNTAPNGIARPQ